MQSVDVIVGDVIIEATPQTQGRHYCRRLTYIFKISSVLG